MDTGNTNSLVPDNDLPDNIVPIEDLPDTSWADQIPLVPLAKTAVGVGENLLSGATGGVGALADALTGADPGTHDLAYRPRTEVGQQISQAIGVGAKKLGGAYDVAFGTGPLATTLKERIPEALGAVGTVTGAAGLARGIVGRAGAFTAEDVPATSTHPLAGASEAEATRLAQIRTTGEKAGLDLPEGGTPARHAKAAVTNQPIANSMAREELNLPPDAPLTPQLLSKARSTFASPAYEAIRKVPKIELGPNYEAAMNDLEEIPGKIPDNLKPPDPSTVSGEGITGERAVDLSKKLRYRANQYDRQAQISGNPEASDMADLHRGTAEALEDAVREHLESSGQGDLAKAWDEARVYTAKTYSVQNALDGAGNVKVNALKAQLLKNKSLSGNLETLANLGAQYPQAFKLSPTSAPAAGLVRRGLASLLPTVATGIGAEALGVPGALAGRILGEHYAEKINPR